LVFLYIKYDEFVRVLVSNPIHKYLWLFQDNTALAMIERSADAWEHNQFKEVVVRAANVEVWVIADLTIFLAKTIF
jgi:clathrin heavy chain